MLTDCSCKANVMNYNSYMSERFVRSVIGGEIYVFSEALDISFYIRHDIKRLLKKDIKLTPLTDLMSLFKIIINSTTTIEKNLMIYIAAVSEAYERSDIDFIG